MMPFVSILKNPNPAISIIISPLFSPSQVSLIIEDETEKSQNWQSNETTNCPLAPVAPLT